MDYFEKIETKPEQDLAWNIPERKYGTVSLVGGNVQNFRAEIKISEYLVNNYPIEKINTVLPDVLKNKLPEVPNFVFVQSTESGSLADATQLGSILAIADYNLMIGDFSKNQITAHVVLEACAEAVKPLLVTRDAVDLLAENNPERVLLNDNVIFLASLTQLQKLLRAVYYPKILLFSQPLLQVVEVLHKFTLSYPISIVTMHNEQILIAKNGIVKAVPLESSGYMPITLWGGELAAKIAALNLYNPGRFVDATVAAVFYN